MKLDVVIRKKDGDETVPLDRKLLFNVKSYELSEDARQLHIVYSGSKTELVKVYGDNEYICVYPSGNVSIENMKVL